MRLTNFTLFVSISSANFVFGFQGFVIFYEANNSYCKEGLEDVLLQNSQA
jgi:hypothetical protein